MRPGADLSEELMETFGFSQPEVRSIGEARAICRAIKSAGRAEGGPPGGPRALHRLMGFFQSPGSEKVFTVFRDEGIPVLIDVFDRFSECGKSDGDVGSDLQFLLKILAIYCTPSGIERLAKAALADEYQDGDLWGVIFDAVPDDPAAREFVHTSLAGRLPKGEAGIGYLNMVNAECREGGTRHRFDSSEGVRFLEDLIRANDPDGGAVSAAAALPFISEPARIELLALAMDQGGPDVQMEAAWASARVGGEAGLKMLARFARDVRYSQKAQTYLEELGRAASIPAEALEPGFQAMAEMSGWLAFPTEYGRPPDEIEVYDTRMLHWPPTKDRRRLWILKFALEPTEPEAEREEHVGMVGSATFVLFDSTQPDMPPEDIYALHCCWELQRNEDPEAPEERTAKTGRSILARHNEGF